jgi:IclR family transcriptional regulator, KDG regulon repressor
MAPLATWAHNRYYGSNMTPRYFVPSVDGAARILALLSRYSTRSLTLSEIVSSLEMSKATCLRVLKTLELHGLLHFDSASKRYSLGYYCVVLGARAEESLDYLSYVRPLLAEATQRTGLTAVFVQRVGADRMMYVAKEESHRSTAVNVSIGNRFPVTEVSYGKWVLAYADQAERDRLVSGGLRRITSATVVDPDQYLLDADTARKEGILTSESEYIPGVTAVSCPVVDAQSTLIGVITVLGFTEVLQGDALEDVRAAIRAVARRAIFDGRPNNETST